MTKRLLSMVATAALLMPVAALAQTVTLTTTLDKYRGPEAYLAFYITDANGNYQKTLWVAGKRNKYYRHLRDWYRGTGYSSAEYDGLTGASLRAGKTLQLDVDIPDQYFDAGYQIRVETAVEHGYSGSPDISVALDRAQAGQAVAGRTYVNSFQFDL
ncbi:MAG: DUF2271 domain-containing protein [Reinekea sp.]|jgi:hypothetical protein